MPSSGSAWRANDVVAYDAMREAANTVIALLLRVADSAAIDDTGAVVEAAAIRQQTFHVDGYDRAAVDAFRERLEDRIVELSAGLE